MRTEKIFWIVFAFLTKKYLWKYLYLQKKLRYKIQDTWSKNVSSYRYKILLKKVSNTRYKIRILYLKYVLQILVSQILPKSANETAVLWAMVSVRMLICNIFVLSKNLHFPLRAVNFSVSLMALSVWNTGRNKRNIKQRSFILFQNLKKILQCALVYCQSPNEGDFFSHFLRIFLLQERKICLPTRKISQQICLFLFSPAIYCKAG